MIRTVGDRMKVKASGGVRTWETAVGYLSQGCDRLGVASTEQILEKPAESDCSCGCGGEKPKGDY